MNGSRDSWLCHPVVTRLPTALRLACGSRSSSSSLWVLSPQSRSFFCTEERKQPPGMKDSLLDSPIHRVLDFFDRRSIVNVDDRKEAITVRDLLNMTSGLDWAEPLHGRPASAIEMGHSPNWIQFILNRPMSSTPGD